MDSWNNWDWEKKYQHRYDLISWLLNQRLSNYGYDLKDFRNMSNKATRLRNKIRRYNINLKNNYGIYSRLYLQNGRFEYCVGQSFNEEYITLMECLSNFKGGY